MRSSRETTSRTSSASCTARCSSPGSAYRDEIAVGPCLRRRSASARAALSGMGVTRVRGEQGVGRSSSSCATAPGQSSATSAVSCRGRVERTSVTTTIAPADRSPPSRAARRKHVLGRHRRLTQLLEQAAAHLRRRLLARLVQGHTRHRRKRGKMEHLARLRRDRGVALQHRHDPDPLATRVDRHRERNARRQGTRRLPGRAWPRSAARRQVRARRRVGPLSRPPRRARRSRPDVPRVRTPARRRVPCPRRAARPRPSPGARRAAARPLRRRQ